MPGAKNNRLKVGAPLGPVSGWVGGCTTGRIPSRAARIKPRASRAGRSALIKPLMGMQLSSLVTRPSPLVSWMWRQFNDDPPLRAGWMVGMPTSLPSMLYAAPPLMLPGMAAVVLIQAGSPARASAVKPLTVPGNTWLIPLDRWSLNVKPTTEIVLLNLVASLV